MRGEKDEVEECGAVKEPLTTMDTKEHEGRSVIGESAQIKDYRGFTRMSADQEIGSAKFGTP
jgi:hypothetical protein